jgi:CubicO group peptidase (beta-lactamase class C family)
MSIQLNRRHFLGGAALVGGLAASPSWAKNAVTRGISANWPQIQAYLDDTVRRKYVPGVGAAIARGLDQAEFMVAGRLAKDEASAAITPDSLWRCYSMTKPITGMAAMMLIEDGKMKMDQNIADFLPEWANPKVLIDGTKDLKSRPSQSPVTIRTLLTHTAGLGYSIITKGPLLKEYLKLGLTPGAVSRKPLPGFDTVAPTAPSLDEFSKRLATLPLIADPTTKWSYSVSLDLMGRVIEVVSGMPFDAFVQQRILNPLGMTSTYWQVPQSEVGKFTTNHAATPFGAFVIDPGSDSIYLDKPAFPFGGAGIVSSMRDYDRFLLMLMGEGAIGQTRIMKRETAIWGMSNLLHPDTQVEGFVKGQGFGAGGRVTIKEMPGGEGLGTYGWGGAASTIGWVDRTRGLRASGWSQIMTSGDQPFTNGFGKAVYASL